MMLDITDEELTDVRDALAQAFAVEDAMRELATKVGATVSVPRWPDRYPNLYSAFCTISDHLEGRS